MELRPVRRPDDVAAVDRLIETVAECDGHRPIGEHKYLDLLHADPGTETGLVAEGEDGAAAYVALTETQEPGTWAMELAIHPLHRSRTEVRTLVDAGVERVGAAGGRRIRVWAFQPNLVDVLESAGFRQERELRQLRRALPTGCDPVFPSGIEVRGFRPGVDDDVWLRVNNAAFRGHPENGSWTRAILDDRKAQWWFDPEGFRMAWEGERLVGFCWTKVHEDGAGEIYVIAVAPGEQGRGLGKALVLEGLHHLHDRAGCEVAVLYVDADNRGALGLYARLGFRLDHVDRSLVKTIDRT